MSDTEPDLLPLASEFPPATRDAWRKLVDGVLKGRPLDTLRSKTLDGLTIEPFYERAAEAVPAQERAQQGPWQVMARIELPDAAAANAEALHELASGAGGLALVFPESVGDHGFALQGGDAALARVLEGVYVEAGVAIEFDGGDAEVAAHLTALLQNRGIDSSAGDIRFGFDPLGAFAARGWTARPWHEAAPAFAASIRRLVQEGFRGPFAAADGRVVHQAGGSEAQELAFALAAAVSYLRALDASGMPLEDARRMIFFRLAADADQWLTAAKFRALRKLWARIEDACGLAPQPAFVSAETAWRMMTRHDPYVNVLRGTVAAFAAALGGADAVAVFPFTAALGLPDRPARRLARNTQLILQEESHVAKVGDAGFGSGALEDITGQLCRAAWDRLQAIEAAGGLAAVLASGSIQREIATVRQARAEAVATRKILITGVSDFPHLSEAPVPVLQATPTVAPAPPANAITAAPLRAMRISEPFEALRDASDRTLLETGARPKVLLATLGRPADFTARATFAKNFFEAGGIEAVSPDDGATLDDSFRNSGAALACLCSSDAVYEAEAAQAARALTRAGAHHVYLAGRPGESEADRRAAGVGSFIYAGCDALAVLETAHDMLETRQGLSRRPRAEP